MINALVTGTGGGVGQSIVKALNLSALNCRIVTTDSNPLASGIYRGDHGYLVPQANSDDFIDTTIDICKKENIDIILIGSDPELKVFAAGKSKIEQETGAKVAVSPLETIEIGYDKWKTYEFLKKNNLPYPRSVLPNKVDELVEDAGFPLIIKPREGSASKDVYIAKNSEDLYFFMNRVEDPIIQEYLRPAEEEYTSGSVVFDGEILGVITLKRELKCGSTYRAFIDNYEIVMSEVLKGAMALNPYGPSNFQMRLTERGPITFEINPRFSGTTALRAYAGFNEPEAVISYALYGEKKKLSFRPEIIAMRYWNDVYIDIHEYNRLLSNRKIFDTSSKVCDYF